MRELTTVETFTITGRGTAYVVHVGDEPPQLHEYILLDGLLCEVTGVGFPVRKGFTELTVRNVVGVD